MSRINPAREGNLDSERFSGQRLGPALATIFKGAGKAAHGRRGKIGFRMCWARTPKVIRGQ